jgi:hypothetical protein
MATTKKRSAYQIEKEIKTIQEDYHKKVDSLNRKETEKITLKLKDLRQELSEVYSDGAKACPDCGNKPHGMKKGSGVYEVGCVVCDPYEEDGNMVSFSARGESPEEAIEKWNEGKWEAKKIQLK